MHLKFDQIFENIIVCGDIHGDIMPLVNKVNDQYKIQNSLIIVAGDVGIGFHKDGYYTDLFKKAGTRLKKNNNIILFVRGNHDDPDKWNDYLPFKAHWQDSDSVIRFIKDYTVISAQSVVKSHNILCVGGALSVDRVGRTVGENYWPNEPFVYDETKVESLVDITDVITHSSPDFCEPLLKNGIANWMGMDKALEADCDKERSDHTLLHNKLKSNDNPLKTWSFGHFHFSKRTIIDGVTFVLLDIMELKEL
ncbi:MAG: Serine/threonine-protein phosphatase PP-X 1-like protein [Candidatus Woesebacteria bacterium GW2011_GWB1_38_5b]|uniref:Serine/threonine-protein phosphatase PP-X 1-like protein n=1 Tax=Candidatus Woesebacteria bacterium GW2011_GWB1_38_5b TaxID=1618569 RepID=A0A0G0K4H3_9BACT|nr:MAG: Serine/threonine-protein phosphatase PP-X 1-like protein [Candidatus Woesebacteria bacterium GW2011_GWB1_38_5b]